MLELSYNLVRIWKHIPFRTPDIEDDARNSKSFPNSYTGLENLHWALRVLNGITTDEKGYNIFKNKFPSIVHSSFTYKEEYVSHETRKKEAISSFFKKMDELRNSSTHYRCDIILQHNCIICVYVNDIYTHNIVIDSRPVDEDLTKQKIVGIQFNSKTGIQAYLP